MDACAHEHSGSQLLALVGQRARARVKGSEGGVFQNIMFHFQFSHLSEILLNNILISSPFCSKNQMKEARMFWDFLFFFA